MIKILIFSKDPSLFYDEKSVNPGDSRLRHIFYVNQLRQRYPGSEIRVITYTPRKIKSRFEEPCDGFCLYGTRSIHRIMYMIDLVRLSILVLSKGWRPDIITVQTPWEEGVIGCFLSRILNAKFLPQLHFDLFSSEWIAESLLNPWRFFISKKVLKSADGIRVVSTLLSKKLVDNFSIDYDRIYVAPVGVNFSPIQCSKRDAKLNLSGSLIDCSTVLFVGRVCSVKNLPLWVEVASIVSSSITNVRFIVVGDGPEMLSLKQKINDLHLQSKFILFGTQSHELMPTFYAAADVFLLTSHYEGFGRVVLESFLSGVPVVSTDCIGPKELIEDGENGYLCSSGDVKGLAGHIVDLLTNQAKAKSMGESGRKKILEKYSLTALTDRIIDTWADIVRK